MKIAAILLCAGNGERFNSPIPKQYQLLGGKKIYRHPLDILNNSKEFSEIVLVIGDDHDKYLDKPEKISTVNGGKTRQESIFLALKTLKDIDYVMICDGVRPFLTKEMIRSHIEKLKEGHKAINTCIPCLDTINIQKNGKITNIPPRDTFLRGQTPQSFCFKTLLSAHQTTKKNYTDDCALVLENGITITYILGCESNIKITTPFDLSFAENLLL